MCWACIEAEKKKHLVKTFKIRHPLQILFSNDYFNEKEMLYT